MKQIIKIDNLQKSFSSYAGELKVLKGINMTIEKGEVIAIVGASGAGKSTLLHIMGTLDKPTSGKVYYDDRDIFQLNNKELSLFRNKTIGFIFQFHHLLPEFNSIENIILPGLISSMDKGYLMDNAQSLLNDLGLIKRNKHRPGELSGGEQQRIAVARALILNPLVVLADEPTGNLDSKTGEELFHLMLDLNKDKDTTFIIVTHNETLADKCHKVYEIVDGKLV